MGYTDIRTSRCKNWILIYNTSYFDSITSDNISRPDLPVSTRIPLHLYKKLIDKVPDAQGYHMYMIDTIPAFL